MERKITNDELDTIKNYMVISFDYNTDICLPYSDGAAIISKLEKAEKVNMERYGGKGITFLNTPVEVTFKTLSQKVYREQKMSLLLGLNNE